MTLKRPHLTGPVGDAKKGHKTSSTPVFQRFSVVDFQMTRKLSTVVSTVPAWRRGHRVHILPSSTAFLLFPVVHSKKPFAVLQGTGRVLEGPEEFRAL